MNPIFQSALEDYLKDKGLSAYLINKTVEQFNIKGISMFKLSDLEKAYNVMLNHDKNVQKVIYPPAFFANGVAMILPKIEPVQYKVSPEFEAIKGYNWLKTS